MVAAGCCLASLRDENTNECYSMRMSAVQKYSASAFRLIEAVLTSSASIGCCSRADDCGVNQYLMVAELAEPTSSS
jgi:hypothetical protein